jgi:predicted transcriptional regulator
MTARRTSPAESTDARGTERRVRLRRGFRRIASSYQRVYTFCMSTMITIRVDDALVREIDRVRRRSDLSRAAAIKDAIRLWLDQQRVEEAVRRHREGYAKKPVTDDEFGPVLGAQRWPT